MKISLDGLLESVATGLEDSRGHSEGGKGYTLRELAANLIEVRDRTERGDLTALDEFFEIYTVAGKSDYKRTPA